MRDFFSQYKIAVVGAGPVGKRIASDLCLRGIDSFAGVVDKAPQLHGLRLDEWLEQPELEGVIEDHIDALPVQPDAVIVATLSRLDACMPLFESLLKRGIRVVSTCEELVYPWLHHAQLAQKLDTLARQHDTAIVGTGVNPGFLMDLFPITVSAVCRDVEVIRVYRIQDASPRRGPFQAKIGAGLGPDEFELKVASGEFGHVGLGESLHLIAKTLGIAFDEWTETIAPVIATEAMNASIGPIARGDVAGILQFAKATANQKTVIELVFQAAIGQADPHDRVQIEGTPPLDVVFKGGVHGDIATAAIAVNTVQPLVKAPAGLHSMATLPVPAWIRS